MRLIPSRTTLSLSILACTALTATARAADNPEVEPNDSKSLATPVTLAPGETISGTSTGTGTSGGGDATYDYFRIKTSAQPLAIYRYRLEMDPAATNWTMTLRGLNQSSVGVIGTTDTTIQISDATLVSGSPTVQWYGFGKQEEIYCRVEGSSSTVGSYSAALVADPVEPMIIPDVIAPGAVTIGPATGNTADIDWWVYDSNFNAIPCAGIDSGNPTGVRTLNLAPGTYYLAFSPYNFANSLPSCAPESFAGAVLDFPNAAVNSGFTSSVANMNVRFTSDLGTFETTDVSVPEKFFIPWLEFTVSDPVGACCRTTGVCLFGPSSGCVAPDVFAGTDTTCSGTTCPVVAGACCNAFGLCRFVAGTDCPGGTTFSGPGSACSPNTCPAAPATCQDFDSIALGSLPNGWTSAVVGATPNALNWGAVNDQSNSAPNAIFTNDVDHVQTQYLTLPRVIASGPIAIDLWSRFATENGFDGWTVEADINGGGFANIGVDAWTLNPYNATISTNFNSPISGQRAFSGTALTWTEHTASLATNPGDQVTLRINMSSDRSAASTGVWIDDVCIGGIQMGSGACCTGDGACAIVDSGSCSGQFAGIGSACSGIGGTCPIAVGACCGGFGSCTFITGTVCPAGQTFAGTGTLCSPNACSVSANACESFDSTSAGSLPLGWTSVAFGGGAAWTVVNDQSNSAPNSAFTNDVTGVSTQYLTLPTVTAGGVLTLDLWNRFQTESSGTNFYDGWTVEASVNSGAFVNIGQGAWTQNGYNATISSGFTSPIAGQSAFSGISGGGATPIWMESVANIPAASGDTVTIRFNMSSDSSLGSTGVWLDDICVSGLMTGGTGSGVCCRGATCNTTITSAGDCTGSGMAGALFVSGSATCNPGAVSSAPCCYANYNKTGGVTVQDIFDFLSDWFASSPYANVGGDGAATPLTVQNIFDFLSDWFAGGCG